MPRGEDEGQEISRGRAGGGEVARRGRAREISRCGSIACPRARLTRTLAKDTASLEGASTRPKHAVTCSVWASARSDALMPSATANVASTVESSAVLTESRGAPSGFLSTSAIFTPAFSFAQDEKTGERMKKRGGKSDHRDSERISARAV
jgi:hypothetical protein